MHRAARVGREKGGGLAAWPAFEAYRLSRTAHSLWCVDSGNRRRLVVVSVDTVAVADDAIADSAQLCCVDEGADKHSPPPSPVSYDVRWHAHFIDAILQ